MTDHIQKTRDMIAVMQAYVDGKPIECARSCEKFELMKFDPLWNWNDFNYRVATTKDSIDWSHVSPEWKFMARDEDGLVYFFVSEPERLISYWRSKDDCCSDAVAFSSYRSGNCDWKDSLVLRPE